MSIAFREAGMTADDAARHCGITRTSMYRYFNLERDPKAEHVAVTAHTTGADPRWLLLGEASKKMRTDDYERLFSAFGMAKAAYEEFEAAYAVAKDQTKIAQETRDKIRDAGRRLNELGGVEAMSAAVYAMFPSDEYRTYSAGSHLNQLWSGIGDWLA